jgi:hypothetical protein
MSFEKALGLSLATTVCLVVFVALLHAAVTAPPAPVSCATLSIDGVNVCNTAVVLTRATDVQSVDHFCKPAGGVPNFTCATPNPSAWCAGSTTAPSGYTAGTWVDIQADASTTGPGWLNVNNCGQWNIKLADGLTDPGNAMVKGSMYHLVSDGTVWRLIF